MKINEAEIRDFRNIGHALIRPCGGVNVIYGENAQGKTNLIEALFLFTGFKSFRGARDRELVRFGARAAVNKLSFTDAARSNTAEIRLRETKRALLNGVELRSARELTGRFTATVFSPDFLSLVRDGPEERRRFVDAALCQTKPAYAFSLAEYNRLLRQRNAVLKAAQPDEIRLLECIDCRLGPLGETLFRERSAFLEVFAPLFVSVCESLSGGRERAGLKYVRRGGGGRSFPEMLSGSLACDTAAKTTTLGIHRDDIEITLNGLSARLYGSQGQQRSCAVALKIAEAENLKRVYGEEPVILLDDVLSELDERRQDYILNKIGDRQVFITCCEPAPIMKPVSGKKFRVENGRVSEE